MIIAKDCVALSYQQVVETPIIKLFISNSIRNDFRTSYASTRDICILTGASSRPES